MPLSATELIAARPAFITRGAERRYDRWLRARIPRQHEWEKSKRGMNFREDEVGDSVAPQGFTNPLNWYVSPNPLNNKESTGQSCSTGR